MNGESQGWVRHAERSRLGTVSGVVMLTLSFYILSSGPMQSGPVTRGVTAIAGAELASFQWSAPFSFVYAPLIWLEENTQAGKHLRWYWNEFCSVPALPIMGSFETTSVTATLCLRLRKFQ